MWGTTSLWSYQREWLSSAKLSLLRSKSMECQGHPHHHCRHPPTQLLRGTSRAWHAKDRTGASAASSTRVRRDLSRHAQMVKVRRSTLLLLKTSLCLCSGTTLPSSGASVAWFTRRRCHRQRHCRRRCRPFLRCRRSRRHLHHQDRRPRPPPRSRVPTSAAIRAIEATVHAMMAALDPNSASARTQQIATTAGHGSRPRHHLWCPCHHLRHPWFHRRSCRPCHQPCRLRRSRH